jgi:hypothetical protein
MLAQLSPNKFRFDKMNPQQLARYRLPGGSIAARTLVTRWLRMALPQIATAKSISRQAL